MDSINVLAELEHIGIVFEWASETEIKCKCPFHEDKNPSCFINIEKRLFKCQTAGCSAKGDFVAFLAGVLQTTRSLVKLELSKRYDFNEAKVIAPSIIERYHSNIWEAKPLLNELKKRGVTKELIEKYRIGELDGRITIPIKNQSGNFVNIRKYLPGAPGTQKMRNMRGRGQNRLFPIDQLVYDKILVTGGELKAIVAAHELNEYNIGAISSTAGEGNWETKFTPLFKDKDVYVCMDIDDAGVASAKVVCSLLSRVANTVYDIKLPLDPDRYPHGDINDYIAQEKGELLALFRDAKPWVLPYTHDAPDVEPKDVSLVEAINAEEAGKRIKIKAVVSAMDTTPYVIPHVIDVMCDKSQKECALCPVFPADNTQFKLHPESPAILDMVATPRRMQQEAIMDGLGIPKTCKVVSFIPVSYYNIEDARLSPQLEITNTSTNHVLTPAYCLGTGLELNETYELTGRMHPHPKTQQSILLISSYDTTKDALSTYELKNFDTLSVFSPSEWTSECIRRKLDEIYEDLEANVTRIYQRRDLHLIIDLVYHSPLFLKFDGQIVKGWLEALILGDSAQGKSETAMNLKSHYALGEKIECKNATVAGLLGGLQKMGGDRFFVSWGIIPMHDRRLVFLEELKGTSREVIAKLTDMRSSGIAEIPKIEKRRTHARTRLVAISNSRSGQNLNAYNFGIEAVKELIGALEDIRRFDIVLLVSSNDLDPRVINKLQTLRLDVEHKFTSDLCRSLILWAWTRNENGVIFEDESTKLVLEHATMLCNTFSDAIPIVDRGSMRHKLARLSAAIAARTFSHRGESILVRPCHVQFISETLLRVYGSETFGYTDMTSALNVMNELLDVKVLKAHLNATPYPLDFVKQMLYTSSIELSDIQDWCGWDRQSAQELLSLLVRKHALHRYKRVYHKSSEFIKLLKDMLIDGSLDSRPDHIKEEF